MSRHDEKKACERLWLDRSIVNSLTKGQLREALNVYFRISTNKLLNKQSSLVMIWDATAVTVMTATTG